jgi:hypothetical protein
MHNVKFRTMFTDSISFVRSLSWAGSLSTLSHFSSHDWGGPEFRATSLMGFSETADLIILIRKDFSCWKLGVFLLDRKTDDTWSDLKAKLFDFSDISMNFIPELDGASRDSDYGTEKMRNNSLHTWRRRCIVFTAPRPSFRRKRIKYLSSNIRIASGCSAGRIVCPAEIKGWTDCSYRGFINSSPAPYF